MQKIIAKELRVFSETIAKRFSYTDRVGNGNNESFSVEEIIPTSDHTAVINFRKSGQRSVKSSKIRRTC